MNNPVKACILQYMEVAKMDVSVLSPDMINQTIVFGPDMLKLIEVELETRKMSYKELAAKVHTATGTIGSWFSRGCIPADKLWSVIDAVDSSALWMKANALIPGNAFAAQYLDGTDGHPYLAIDESIECAKKFIQDAEEAKKIIRNKKRGYEFTGNEEQIVIDMEDGLADINNFNQMALVSMEEYFGRKVRTTMNRCAERNRERGYCTQEKNRPMRAVN
jgi:hypothetical protein